MNWEIVKSIFVVGAGSFFGGTFRYLISIAMKKMSMGFPWGTLLVNLSGSFLLGLLWGYFSRVESQENGIAMFLMVGFCGGFTTFSTFSKELFVLLQSGDYLPAIGYAFFSLLAGVALVAFGYLLVR